MLPDIPGIDHALVFNDIFDLSASQDSIAIVSEGYISVKFACILSGLGSGVNLWHRGKWIFRGFDEDVRDILVTEMVAKRIRFRTQSGVLGLVRTHDGSVALSPGHRPQGRYDSELYATGRVPNTSGLGLEQRGVLLDSNGAIEVDAYSATSVASIHAIGDVTARPQPTPVATDDAMLLASSLVGSRRLVNREYIPSAVLTSPAAAVVGLAERSRQSTLRHIRRFQDFLPTSVAYLVRAHGKDVHEVCGGA